MGQRHQVRIRFLAHHPRIFDMDLMPVWERGHSVLFLLAKSLPVTCQKMDENL